MMVYSLCPFLHECHKICPRAKLVTRGPGHGAAGHHGPSSLLIGWPRPPRAPIG